MAFRKGKLWLLLSTAMLLATFWGIKSTNAGIYLSSPHGDTSDANLGVNRDAAYARGHCAQCHDPHSGTTGGYNLIYEGNAMCFNNGGANCHNAQPTTYPCGESDRLPSSDSANHYYFENNTAGIKDTGVNNRCRWPGSSVYTDTATDSTSSTYYSPHYMDTDMPKRDSSNRGLCTNCHNPHGAASPQLDMLLNVYNTPGPTANYSVCFSVTTSGGSTYTCHDMTGVPSTAANTRIKSFYDQVDTQAGHQIRGSTVNIIGSLPTGISVGDKMPCYNCHNPHGSEGANGMNKNAYLITDQSERGWSSIGGTLTESGCNAPDTRSFCLGCHRVSNGTPAAKTVMGISMAQLPNTMGEHASTSTANCSSCHGQDYSSSSGRNVHHPDALSGAECKSCHSTPRGAGGIRRQVTSGGITGGDIGNDTGKASYHIARTYAQINSTDCQDCHEQTQHMCITDPGVRLYDPDNGATVYSYTGTATQLNTFCVNCHDANGASRAGAGGTQPFNALSGDSTTVPNIATFWGRTYNHNKSTPTAAGCMHCHGNSGNNNTTQNPRINGHGSTADKLLTDGINFSNNGAGVAPTYDSSRTTIVPTSGSLVDLDYQYRVCFTCHANWSGVPAGMPTRNLAIEFNVNNDSYHWAEGDKTASSGSTPRASTVYGNFNTTYVYTMMPRYAGYSNSELRQVTMRCSDCHGGNGVTSTSLQGPHGSTSANILKVPSGSSYTTWSATVSVGDSNVWCFNCHLAYTSNSTPSGFSGSDGSLHRSKHNGEDCQDCHLRVPHGSGLNDSGTALVGSSNQRKRLLNPYTFDDEWIDTNRSGGDYQENDHNYLRSGHPT